MTQGISNFVLNGAAFPPGGTPVNGADTGDFPALMRRVVTESKTGGTAFRADVKDAGEPSEKTALIQGYAEGFAAGAGGATQETMRGLADIAEDINKSDLPKEAKNKMLDNIAKMMSKLDGGEPASASFQPTFAPQQSQPFTPQFQGQPLPLQGQPSAPQFQDPSFVPLQGQPFTPQFQDPSLVPLQGQPLPLQGQPAPQFQAPTYVPSQGQPVVPFDPATVSPDPSVEGPEAPPAAEEAQVWSHDVKDGKGTIELGDKYTITLNEGDASATIKNKETGQETKIWGDPHVDIGNDGKNEFDFKKDMTFQLDDGTKITVGTVPGDKDGVTYSSSLTITNGDKAMEVTGLGQSFDGKNNLEVRQSDAGRTLDQLTNDGSTTVHESGGKWTIPNTKDGQDLQDVINVAESDGAETDEAAHTED